MTTRSPRPAYRRLVPPSTRITSARFAPELSATLTMDSCWIIGVSCVLGSLPRAVDDLDETPALVLRQRPRLDDAHEVSGLRRVLLVVRFHLLRARDHL